MVNSEQEVHRPGVFKKPNKAHKHGRHKSKRSISESSKGRVSVKSLSKKHSQELRRVDRRNQINQIRKNKRQEVLLKKRLLGGMNVPPFLVCVLPLSKNQDATRILSLLTQCDSEAVVKTSNSGVTHICLPRFKQRFAFVVPPVDKEWAVLDCLKVCDTVLFLLSTSEGYEDDDMLIDRVGNSILTSALAQGLPTPVFAVTNIEDINGAKKKNQAKRAVENLIETWFKNEKVFTLDSESDALNVLRRIGEQKKKSIICRDKRPHLYAEEVNFVPDEEGATGSLKVSGYLRGTTLNVNDLVHIPGMGDFQMSQIDELEDPFKIQNNRKIGNDSMEVEKTISVKVSKKCDPHKQISLKMEADVNPMDSEQTWPTEEEEKEAEQPNLESPKKKQRLPPGWSTYQGSWLVDNDNDVYSNDDEEEDEDDDERDEYEAGMELLSREEESMSEEDENQFDTASESEVEVDTDKYDQQMDLQEERTALVRFKEAKEDLEFPDEVDTPQDIPARTRFQKYRGLESFRTSPWDRNESLPSDYARIYRFKDYDKDRRTIQKALKSKEGFKAGSYVTLHLSGVPEALYKTFAAGKHPLIVIGLLPFERQMSVVNTFLSRTSNFNIPIKSKERLIFQCGYRRFAVRPIFSQHTAGDKHKFERYFQPGSNIVASFYAPIQYSPAPVHCWKEVNGKLVLVATGSLLSCNADRLIIKRVVLSGHPFKVHKKSSVIRFMFFNPDDINYFKKLNLSTKKGLIGKIKEPLGTHGHFKANFNGQLKSQDTVLLNLYKRVFPKWTYEALDCSNSNF